MAGNVRPALNEAAKRELDDRIGDAFSPAAPIDRRSLFAGRTAQMQKVIDVIRQRGQHAVIYGERGVGKTSLAAVMAEVIGSAQLLAPRANCDGTDDFSTIWRKVLESVSTITTVRGAGFRPQVRSTVSSANSLLPPTDPVRPIHVSRVLTALGNACTTVIIIDEFDRLEDAASRALFADTLKMLSDQSVPATLVLVGVADNVEELIAEHRSVERSLVQIQMPRMSRDELAEIISRGLEPIRMTIEESAVKRITHLSQGLPHYTHLLTQLAARNAVQQGARDVQSTDVDAAIVKAIDRAQESTIQAYYRAIFSTRGNLYAQVLLGCALAKSDELGSFAASDVRAPFSTIMGLADLRHQHAA